MLIYIRTGIMPAMPMDQTKLKSRREALGLTQAQVAARAEMTQQNYARIETGDRNDPVLSTAERIADALETTLDALRAKPKRRGK
jgi:transcriptional regulator with XRE-family HTH domain